MAVSVCQSIAVSMWLSVTSCGVSVCGCVCVSVAVSMCQLVAVSVCHSVAVSVCQSVAVSVCLSVDVSVWLSVAMSVCLSVAVSVCHSVVVSVCQSVAVSVCLSVAVSVCLCAVWPTYLTSFLTGKNVPYFPDTLALLENILKIISLFHRNAIGKVKRALKGPSPLFFEILIFSRFFADFSKSAKETALQRVDGHWAGLQKCLP